MAVRIVQYLVFTCFLRISCTKVDSNRRFIRQLDIFKREVRDELSYVAADINTLFESFVGINKTLQNNVNVNEGRPDGNIHARVDMDKNNEQYVVKPTLFEGLSEKYIMLQKAFESEKQLNRELRDHLKSFESELKSFESKLKSFEAEKQLTRQLQDRIKGLESGKQLNHELQNRLKAVEDSISGIYADVVSKITSFTNHVEGSPQELSKRISCEAKPQSGVVDVYIESIGAVKSVYCDAKTDGGGWTVIMRRQDGSVDFNRSWTEYKNGFGNVDGEFWLGNEAIHALIKTKPRELRIDMHDFDGNKAYAKYDTFEIEPESDKYRLELSGYSGTAGDAMVDSPFDWGIHNGFPNVISCIDGTFIKIKKPSLNEQDFVCRKGYHALNVQICCDNNFIITSVNSTWPGSVHDSRIFRSSAICNQFENGQHNGFLLGDSGYPCKRFLLMPFLNPVTVPEQRFNQSLCRTRVLIEQTLGILKRRFQILQQPIRLSPEKAVDVIITCSGLHNIGIKRGEIVHRDVIIYEHAETHNVEQTIDHDGSTMRDHIVNTYFT